MGFRKGQTVGVDFAIAMSIFVITVVTGIMYVVNLSIPASPFGEQVRDSSMMAGDRFVSMNSWEYELYSVGGHVSGVEDYPVELDFSTSYPLSNHSRVLENGINTTAEFFDRMNQTVFLADFTNNYELLFSESKELENPDVDEKVYSDGDDVVTNDMGLEADMEDEGFEKYGSETYKIFEGNFGFSSDPDVYSGSLREYFDYGDVSVRFFADSSIVKMSGNEEITLNFSEGYEEGFFGQYQGYVEHVDFSEGEEIDNENYDFFNLTGGSEPFYFLSRDMEVMNGEAENGNIVLDISFGSDDSLFYYGEQQDFESMRTVFFEPGFEELSVPRTFSGLSNASLSEFEDMESDTAARSIGADDMRYNITVVDDFSVGMNIPSGQDVFVLEYPVVLSQETGNRTMKPFRVALWS